MRPIRGAGAGDEDHGREAFLLDGYLDAPGDGPPSGLDPAVAAVVDRLRGLGTDEWDRLAPYRPPHRPWRRDLALAAAAVVVAIGLLFGLTAGGGPTGTTAARGARWRMTSLLSQASWNLGSTAVPSETITCPSSSQCLAASASSAVVEQSGDGGHTFTPTSLPNSSTITTSVSCPTPLVCLAGGLAPASGLTGVPAISASVLAGGNATAGGTGGSPLPTTGFGVPADPVDGTGTPILLGTVDGGGTWSPQVMPSQVSQVVDVVCTSQSNCAVVVDLVDGSSAVLVTGNGGQTWSSSGPLSTGFAPAVHQGLACRHRSCVLVGTDNSVTPATAYTFSSDDGGQTWSSGAALVGMAAATAVQCPVSHVCIAIGQAPAPAGTDAAYGPGVVLTSDDAGTTWSTATGNGLPAANLYTLACTTKSQCWVGGALTDSPVDTGYAMVAGTNDGGADFTVASLPATDPTGNALDYDAVLSLSCVHGGCVALAVLSTEDTGSSGAQVVLANP